MKAHLKPVQYHDLIFRLTACLIGAHIVVVYGDPRSTFEILLLKSYYLALAGSFVIAFVLFSLMRWIIIRLDHNFDWNRHPAQRAGMQLVAGLGLPALLAFLLAWAYFQLRGGVNILHTSYIRYDFEFIVSLLVMINLYYVAYSFFARWKQAEQLIRSIPHTSISEPKRATYQVSKGATNFLLPMDAIACFYRDQNLNKLRTFENEEYFIEETLDEVTAVLPEDNFFRANRQLIVNREACKGFDLLSYGKLDLRLHPDMSTNTVISQKRAVQFKKWLEQNAAA
ncbi:LytTR family DNA-binding domain-containing protein [Taibaiella koreensis]|uniref:LytTR family DNA-binding domain-containing protein n=1 Tax=Taibaiella koreensis TaxID=1268548 RepID=UPI0013C2BCCE|nr:LytTR family DNA-binding domain-containing protein [Taibaiella koreensis]